MKKLWLCLLLVLLTGCSVSKSEPQPTCGPYGPPWIWEFENLKRWEKKRLRFW